MRRDAARCVRARGLVLLAVLMLLVLVGLAALVGAEVWATALQREREAELLFVGEQYRRAIESYWRASPTVKTLPTSLDQLLEDDRFPTPVRHLRRRYADPMTGSTDWGLIKLGNGIAGVHSTSKEAPLKQSGFAPQYIEFERAGRYDQWRFVFKLPRQPGAPARPRAAHNDVSVNDDRRNNPP
ncbi:MAG: type II secretion system protein [Burkholderiaceae bacterium]